MDKPQSASVATLKAIVDAFNAHDLDAIMEFLADDCSLDMPRGPEPWGKRFTGKAAVREGLAMRFKGLPDVHYGDDRHWISGNMGVCEWSLTGTTPDGVRIHVRRCDHWEFRDGRVISKHEHTKWYALEGASMSITALQPTAASALRLLAVPSSLRSSAAAKCERYVVYELDK